MAMRSSVTDLSRACWHRTSLRGITIEKAKQHDPF
jgi:hypothetical protein